MVGGGGQGASVVHLPSSWTCSAQGPGSLRGWPTLPALGIWTDLGATQRDFRNQEGMSGLGVGGQGEEGGPAWQCRRWPLV